MLEVKNLVAGYQQDIMILQGMSLDVKAQEIAVVIGANGVGKSTLLKAIYGLVKPSAGQVICRGHDLTSHSPYLMVRQGLSFVPQGHTLFPFMSVRENLELGCWTFRRDSLRMKRAMDTVLERFPELANRLREQAGNMSGGLQRLLEIARSLLTEPVVLLLDEPTVGLAPSVASRIYSEIRQLASDGLAILLVDQNVRSAVEIADTVYEVDMGKVSRKSSGDDVRRRIDTLAREWLI